jgi:hypothetical protein
LLASLLLLWKDMAPFLITRKVSGGE